MPPAATIRRPKAGPKAFTLPVNLWQRLAALPPCLVRMLAKKGNAIPLAEQAMSDEEVAAASGLPVPTVRLLSHLRDWHGVELTTAQAFLVACRVDVTSERDMSRVRDYLTKDYAPRWKYLRLSPHYETTFRPLMRIYAGLR